MHRLTADVAIIGGGAAGCYAALNLQKRGLKPLIICKGLVGKSGASLFAGNLVISGGCSGTARRRHATPPNSLSSTTTSFSSIRSGRAGAAPR